MGSVKIALFGFLKFQRKKLLFTIMICILFTLLNLFLSFIGTINGNMKKYWGENLLGDGMIVKKTYKKFDILSQPIPKESFFKYAEFNDKKDKRYITAPRLRTGALFESDSTNWKSTGMLIGVDSEKEQKITSGILVIDGHYPQTGKKEVVMFSNIAERLGISVGDRVIITAKTKDGYVNYEAAVLSGIVQAKNVRYFFPADNMDSFPVYASIDMVRELKMTEPDVVSEIVIKFNPSFENIFFDYKFGDEFKYVGLADTAEMLSNIKWIMNFLQNLILSLIIAVLLTIVYYNTNVLLKERKREFSILITFGAYRNRIIYIWFLESSIYILYCLFWGMIATVLSLKGINSLGLYSTSPSMTVIFGADKLDLTISLMNIIVSVLIVVLTVFISTFLSITKYLKEDTIVKLAKGGG